MNEFLSKLETAKACGVGMTHMVFSSMWNQLAAQLPSKLAEGQIHEQQVALPGSHPTITMRKQRDKGLEKISLAKASLPEFMAHYASIAKRLHEPGKAGFTMTLHPQR